MKYIWNILWIYGCIQVCVSQTYLFHQPSIYNDSLRKEVLNDTTQSMYEFNRTCTIYANVLGKDSIYCPVTGDIFHPSEPPCDIDNLFTFDCMDSVNRVVFEAYILKGKYRGNYIIHHPTGYVKLWMTLDDEGMNGPAYMYYDMPGKTYIGKTYDKGPLMAELEYKNNVLWNVKKILTPQGKSLKKGSFSNGKGTLNIYRANGSLLRSVELVNGQLNGICTYYYATGQVLMTGRYTNNLQEVTWIEYDLSGNQVQKIEYQKESLIKVE